MPIDLAIVKQKRYRLEKSMNTVKLSPKFQVVIPKTVRDHLHLLPGQRMQVVEYDGRVELIPEKDLKELRGFVKGINIHVDKEVDRL